MHNYQNLKNHDNDIDDIEIKSLVINKDEDGNFKSEPVALNDGTKVEFIAELENEELTKTRILRDLQAVEEYLCGTHDLTNHADSVDYIAAVSCGILCGLIDSFFVGEWNFKDAKAKSNLEVNAKIIEFAKKEGYKGDRLDGAIRFLEKKYTLPGDNEWNVKKMQLPGDGVEENFITAKTHHLDDFCHHPTLVGLLCNVIVQFTETSIYSNKDGELIQLPVTVNDYGQFQGKNTVSKFFCGIVNWFMNAAKAMENAKGHWMSDLGGTSQSAGGGAGLPGHIMSLLKELSAIPIFKNPKFSENLRKAYQNGIGTGKKQIDLGAFNALFEGAQNKFDYRTENAILGELKRQALPVIINEALVRGFYFIRHFINELKEHSSLEEINWKNVIPFKNRTIVRMLTISKGTFEIIDVADAAIRSGGFTDTKQFLLHLNFVGAVSFGITVIIDVGMGVKKYIKERAYGCPKNLKLIRLYQKHADGLSKVFKNAPCTRNSFGPLFLHIDEKRYEKTNIKVMFIRMENHLSLTYDESLKTPKKLLSMFEMYKDYKFSPTNAFGNFAKKITQSLNTSPNNSMFIWNSIYKFSKPNKEIENAENHYFNLLVNEIKICKPDAVIFMTGKKYDNHIQAKFKNTVDFQQICINSGNKKLPDLSEKCFAKLVSNNKNLPEHIYRISNPNSLFFRLFKRTVTVNWLRKLILGIEPEEKEKRKKERKINISLINIRITWKAILIILAIILLLFLFRACKSCTFNQKENPVLIPTVETQKEEKTVVIVEKTVLKETKSFEFRADRRDFVNPQEAEIWFDNMAREIHAKLKQDPTLKFKICGYVAEFENEIDEMALASERAENIKKGLIERGVAQNILITVPIGRTTRWGEERKLNRAVTIESVAE